MSNKKKKKHENVTENSNVSTAPIKDFEDVEWNKRQVYIFFDADKWEKPEVLHAEASLWSHLKRELHADCKVVNMKDKTKGKGYLALFVVEVIPVIVFELLLFYVVAVFLVIDIFVVFFIAFLRHITYLELCNFY